MDICRAFVLCEKCVSSQQGKLRSYMYIFPFLVDGGTEGICTCTEEHEIKYEYHDEQKHISPFAQGKVVICMMNNNP